MAHSLEARVPFLDPVVTNLAFALPTKHKVRGLSKKVLLRKAVAPLLPHEVVHGRKRGFSIPAAAWLRGDLEPFARATLSAETLRRQGFFRPETVSRLIDEHVAGAEDRSRQLWGLLAFTLWYERHVEQEPPHLSSGADGGAARVSDYPPFGLGYPRTELRRQLVDAVLAGEKTATAGLAEEYAAEGEAVPVAGDRFLLEGFDEEPIAVVEVTEAQRRAGVRDRRPVRARRGRGLRDGRRLARRARDVLRPADRAGDGDRRDPLPRRRGARVRVWIDMTASAHVLVFRPLIEIMRGRGDEVQITARDYAQTLQLLELHGLEAER